MVPNNSPESAVVRFWCADFDMHKIPTTPKSSPILSVRTILKPCRRHRSHHRPTVQRYLYVHHCPSVRVHLEPVRHQWNIVRPDPCRLEHFAKHRNYCLVFRLPDNWQHHRFVCDRRLSVTIPDAFGLFRLSIYSKSGTSSTVILSDSLMLIRHCEN